MVTLKKIMSKEDVSKELDRITYLTGINRGGLVMLIAEMNSVSRQSVYQWLRNNEFSDRARVLYALQIIEMDYAEQAATV